MDKQSTVFSRYKVWIVVGIIVILLLYAVLAYNRFIRMEQNVNGKWSEVENQYQRQADLIPNLVSVLASAVDVETEFVKDIIEARTQWLKSGTQYDKDTAGVRMNNGISAAVSAVAENYPVLQANKQYTALMDELAGTQNRITVARGRYIESIQAYNTAIKRFPANMLAGMFGFGEKAYYTAESMITPVLGAGVLP